MKEGQNSIINDENIQHSSPNQQKSSNNIEMNKQQSELKMQNIHPITIMDFSNPTIDNQTHQSHIEATMVKYINII